MYVDTHCNIIKQYYNNIDEVLDNASKAGVEKILICGYDLASNIEVLELLLCPAIILIPSSNAKSISEIAWKFSKCSCNVFFIVFIIS